MGAELKNGDEDRRPGAVSNGPRRAFQALLAAMPLLTVLHAQDAIARPRESPPLKIVAFGNSLTASAHWPRMLERELSVCLARPVSVDVVAQAGATTQWALDQINSVSAKRPDVVLVQFAENDAAIHRFTSLSASRMQIGQVLDGLRGAEPRARIVGMAMNPVWGPRAWVRPFLSSYITAHRQEAESRDLAFVDFRPYWSTLPDSEMRRWIPDGLHPDPEKAGQMMMPVLIQHLAPGGCRTNPVEHE